MNTSRCNLCTLKMLEHRAANNRMRVVVRAGIHPPGGFDVYVLPRARRLPKFPSRAYRDMYLATWMQEVPEWCVCDSLHNPPDCFQFGPHRGIE